MDGELPQADTVFFLDYPIEVCLKVAKARLGKPRPDVPWPHADDTELDEEFRQWILDYPADQLPLIRRLLEEFSGTVHIFHSREEADGWLENTNI